MANQDLQFHRRYQNNFFKLDRFLKIMPFIIALNNVNKNYSNVDVNTRINVSSLELKISWNRALALLNMVT